ncbi:mCG126024, partial [Mus musculus]
MESLKLSPANRRRGRPPKRISFGQEDSIASKQTAARYRNKAIKERDKLLKQEEMRALEVLEEALVGNDSEGPLCELLFFFLTAIFQAMAEEEEEVAKEQITDADTKDLTEALDEDADPTKSALSAVAALAAAWPQLHQGADVTSANAKYRYQKRGGFDATDDACMELRLSNPSLVKKLSSTSVYDLTPGEKMKILHALCGKLLTLVSTRDFIEDYVDVLRQAKQEFRELKAEQHRKEREATAARIRRRKEEKLKEQEQKMKEKQEKLKEDEQRNSAAVPGEEEREDFDTSTENKNIEQKDLDPDVVTEDEDDPGSHKRSRRGKVGQTAVKQCIKQEEMNYCIKQEPLSADAEEALRQEQQQKEKELLDKIQSAIACTNIFPLGRDRLYRRYWIFPSIPGLFIEEDYSGLTEDMLLPRPSSFHNNAQPRDPQVSIKTEESFLSESTSSLDQGPFDDSVLLPKPVHKPNRWCFYSSCAQLDQLIDALNSRGHRESALKETLLQEKSRICAQLAHFSEEKFHFSDKPQADSKPVSSRGRSSGACDISQMSAERQLELRLRDFLLDIEDRIYQGTLGAIKVTDRQVWRSALENGRYELLSEESKENGVIKTVNEDVEEMEMEQARVIVRDRLLGIKTETPSTISTSASTPQSVSNVVHYLALALFQIEQGIERRFLKAPLDGNDSGRSYKTVLDRWRESLLSSASLSQVFLHLSTLDRSVMWSKSILNARCKICRKKGDAENMVLCDGCDRGHHTYCVRPKLKAVPDGDWFCPECRPKQRSRRLSSRQRPSLESDEEMEEEGQSEEEEYEVEQDEEDSDDDEALSPPKRGRPQVRLPIKTKGRFGPSFPSRSQRQDPGRYPSRSQQSTPKNTAKSASKNLRKTRSAPPTETRSLRVGSRSTRHSPSALQDVFVELLSPHSKRRGRKESSPVPLNRRSSGRQGGVHELSAFEQLVVELVRHDDSWPFLKLVSKIQVPDYYDIIKKPIALNIIREKVNKCEYKLACE